MYIHNIFIIIYNSGLFDSKVHTQSLLIAFICSWFGSDCAKTKAREGIISSLSWTSLLSEHGLCVGMIVERIPSPRVSGHKHFAILMDHQLAYQGSTEDSV